MDQSVRPSVAQLHSVIENRKAVQEIALNLLKAIRDNEAAIAESQLLTRIVPERPTD